MSDERATSSIDRHLGQRLRSKRLQIGLSQERLADSLGVTFQQVQKYEKGHNRIAASRLFDIAAILQVPVSYFFEGYRPQGSVGVKEDGPDDLVFDVLATPEGVQLVTLFANIRSPRLRRKVIELIRALAVEDESVDESQVQDM